MQQINITITFPRARTASMVPVEDTPRTLASGTEAEGGTDHTDMVMDMDTDMETETGLAVADTRTMPGMEAATVSVIVIATTISASSAMRTSTGDELRLRHGTDTGAERGPDHTTRGRSIRTSLRADERVVLSPTEEEEDCVSSILSFQNE